MKELTHKDTMRRPETSSRKTNSSEILRKFKRVGEAGVVALGLAFGIGAPLIIPGIARAQDVVINGRTIDLTVVRLNRTLGELDRETERYREDEFFPASHNNHTYSIAAVIPGEVDITITLASQGDNKGLDVVFPAERESTRAPVEITPGVVVGVRGLDLNGFAAIVQEFTGQELQRVRIVLETGTFELRGVETTYTDIYVLPVDQQGRVLTSLGGGEYVVFGATYYGDTLRGGVVVLAEPTTTSTVAVAMR
ncbi:hypothetical protein KKB44_04890 [Candidatus Micrarchaeota archaeon]|nr:hypothetical protein [Candidatus Micrarchaeota archaeon]